MNERIKELADQAGFQYIKDEGIGWAGNYNDSLPKFAELIVKECMYVGRLSQINNGLVDSDIKDHFYGVEDERD